MKAFTIDAPGKTGLRDLAEPVLEPDDVLLRVRTVGFCGSDLNTFRGLNPMVQYPRIPGHEIAGIIEATGAMVPGDFKVGQAVTLSPYTSCGKCPACRADRPNCCQHNETLGVQREGALTAYLAVPWRKLFTSAKLNLRELALVEPLTVGFHAVDRARVRATDTVAVLGCGAIGLGAIAGAAARDATVIAVDIDDDKLAIASQAGADLTLNTRDRDIAQALRDATDGDGPAVVIEAIGLPLTFRAAVEAVAFAGRVVYIGYAKEPVTYETKLFVQKELDIYGSRNAEPQNFEDVIKLLEGKKFPVDAMISSVVPIEEAGDALQSWADDPARVTKIHVDLPAG